MKKINLDISVIISTLNHCQSLERTIKSLQKQDFRKGYEIIVVDNNSTDETKEIIKSFSKKDKKIKYLLEKRLGIHFCRNSGAKKALGKILAFGDDDAVYARDWLKEIYKTFQSTRALCVGGQVIPRWDDKKPVWLKEVPLSYFSIINEKREGYIKKPLLAGVNFAIFKKILFEVGGFNPEVFGDIWLGDGETGLQRKLLNKNYAIFYQPKAVCWHIINRGKINLNYIKKRAANDGRQLEYSNYKANQFSKIKLLLRSIYFGVFSFVGYIFYLYFWFLRRLRYFHYAWIYSAYKARVLYELRLIFNRRFRKFVLRENWLN